MNIRFRQVPYVGVRRFQEGGPMEAPQEGGTPEEMPQEGVPEQGGAPEQGGPQGGGDPMEMLMQIAQIASQALQSKDCNAAMQACDGLMQFMEMVQGGGQPAPNGEPVYRRGGKLVGFLR